MKKTELNLEDKISYGICINGNLTTMWSKDYPPQGEIEFHMNSRVKSLEIVERVEMYEIVAKIK